MKATMLLALAMLTLLAASWLGGRTLTPTASAAPPLEWDHRLNDLNVSYQPAADCSQGCWRLISARYEDRSESGENHNLYGRLRDEAGTVLAGYPWKVAWPDGSVTVMTKPAPEWSDFPLYGCYFPDQGASGGYRAFAGTVEARSDSVHGMGLPYCWHVNFRLIWQWQPPGSTPTPTSTPPAPTATATPVSNPSPSALAWLYFPMTFGGIPDLPAPTASPTPPAPSPTPPLPTPTPVPPPPYSGSIVQTFPNCGLTQVFGVVHDAAGQPLPGTRLRLTWDGPNAEILYATAGDYVRNETDASGWDFVLAQQPVANSWRVAVVDPANPSRLLSPEVTVQTVSHCEPWALNVGKLKFERRP